MSDLFQESRHILRTCNSLQVCLLIFQLLSNILSILKHPATHLSSLLVLLQLKALSLPLLINLTQLLFIFMLLVSLVNYFRDFFREILQIKSKYLLQCQTLNIALQLSPSFSHQLVPMSCCNTSRLQLNNQRN